MKKLIGMLILLNLATNPSYSQKLNVKKQILLAEKQLANMLQEHTDTSKTPFSVHPDGRLKDMPTSWWCSGFFAGSLWYLYEYTGKPVWREAAHTWSMALQKEQYNQRTHDLGFMLYCSLGNGYRLTGDSTYAQILLNGAKSLASRFDAAVGLIKSWDKWKGYDYPVIIDNMMNLEYLFWAARKSGDSLYYQIPLQHADRTMKNHFRSDFSSFHVVCYDSSGGVLAKKTHQGFSDESAWARGQGWALYGYTTMYRETGDQRYLDLAEKIAAYYLGHPHLPGDGIPYWDFNAPNIPDEERDASTAALVASALLELSTHSNGRREEYFQAAEQMLSSLSEKPYRASVGENNNFLLKHSVGFKPEGKEVNVPLVYADYYYLEALIRYEKLKNGEPLFPPPGKIGSLLRKQVNSNDYD